jgi:hypothetical protein
MVSEDCLDVGSRAQYLGEMSRKMQIWESFLGGDRKGQIRGLEYCRCPWPGFQVAVSDFDILSSCAQLSPS